MPQDARASLKLLASQITALQAQIDTLDKRLHAQHRQCPASRRLETIPGIGVIGAAALAATSDPKAFKSGRDLAAFIGLVPRNNSSGGKQRLGPISKQGDRYLRRILVVGAHSILKQARTRPDKHPWLARLMARKPGQVGGGGSRQQDCAHRLGRSGTRRELPSADGARCSGLERAWREGE